MGFQCHFWAIGPNGCWMYLILPERFDSGFCPRSRLRSWSCGLPTTYCGVPVLEEKFNTTWCIVRILNEFWDLNSNGFCHRGGLIHSSRCSCWLPTTTNGYFETRLEQFASGLTQNGSDIPFNGRCFKDANTSWSVDHYQPYPDLPVCCRYY